MVTLFIGERSHISWSQLNFWNINSKVQFSVIYIDTLLFRSRLTIIPQEPTIFSGSLRFNLDPGDSYSDEAVHQALQTAGLGKVVQGFTEGLHHQVIILRIFMVMRYFIDGTDNYKYFICTGI